MVWTDEDCFVTGVEPHIPDLLLLDNNDVSESDGDLLIRGFFDTLRTIQTMHTQLDEPSQTAYELEKYTRQLLYDFMRILFLANKSTLGKCELGEVQIRYFVALHNETYTRPPGRMTFNLNGVEYVLVNDGSVIILRPKEDTAKGFKAVRAIPISLEVFLL